jgi:hypothetical protein
MHRRHSCEHAVKENRSFVFNGERTVSRRMKLWRVPCIEAGMHIHTQYRLSIVIHGKGNAMTMLHHGKVTRTRTFEPERLWVGPALGESMGPLSLSFCKETYPVLNECVKFVVE